MVDNKMTVNWAYLAAPHYSSLSYMRVSFQTIRFPYIIPIAYPLHLKSNVTWGNELDLQELDLKR